MSHIYAWLSFIFFRCPVCPVCQESGRQTGQTGHLKNIKDNQLIYARAKQRCDVLGILALVEAGLDDGIVVEVGKAEQL